MKTFRNELVLGAAAMILALAAPVAFGQHVLAPAGNRADEMMLAENDAAPGDRPALTEEKREELRKKIESVRIWRLTEALKLDPQTSAKLAAILGPFDLRRRDIQREQIETMRALRKALKTAKPDESKIKAALETLEKNHSAMQDLRSKEFNSLKSILSVEQQARYVVFQQEFQREMRSMIAGARGNERGGAGGQGGRPRMRGDQTPPE